MNQEAIKELLNRFYEGTLSFEEEEQLRSYFLQEKIDDNLEGEKSYFLAMQAMQAPQLDESFDTELSNHLVESNDNKSRKLRSYTITGIAATIAVFLAIWFGTDLLQPKEVYGTIHDPVLAFSETKMILDEVSKKMNQGLKPVKETADKVDINVRKTEVVKKVDKAIKKTQKVKTINETMDIANIIYVSFGG